MHDSKRKRQMRHKAYAANGEPVRSILKNALIDKRLTKKEYKAAIGDSVLWLLFHQFFRLKADLSQVFQDNHSVYSIAVESIVSLAKTPRRALRSACYASFGFKGVEPILRKPKAFEGDRIPENAIADPRSLADKVYSIALNVSRIRKGLRKPVIKILKSKGWSVTVFDLDRLFESLEQKRRTATSICNMLHEGRATPSPVNGGNLEKFISDVQLAYAEAAIELLECEDLTNILDEIGESLAPPQLS